MGVQSCWALRPALAVLRQAPAYRVEPGTKALLEFPDCTIGMPSFITRTHAAVRHLGDFDQFDIEDEVGLGGNDRGLVRPVAAVSP